MDVYETTSKAGAKNVTMKMALLSSKVLYMYACMKFSTPSISNNHNQLLLRVCLYYLFTVEVFMVRK